MSTAVSSGVWLCGPEEMAAKFLLLALADNADDFGFAFPSHATLAQKVCCDKRTVIRRLEQLHEEGWIRIGRKLVNGKGNVYFVNLDRIGVSVSPMARKSPLHSTLEKRSGDILSRIFLPRKSGDTRSFSGDNPHPQQVTKPQGQVTSSPTQVTKALQIGDTAVSLKPSGTTNPEPSAEPSGEPSTSAEPVPLPPAGGGISPDEEVAWSGLKQDLERALRSNLPLGLETHRFEQLRPGENDWKVAFDAWWLLERRSLSGTMTFFTHALEPAATRAGLAKYERRLALAARKYFALSPHTPVQFVVRETETLNPAA